MMESMGYDSGKGLGKQNQGIVEPIVAVQQSGRKGLGMKLEEIHIKSPWDATQQKISIPEKLEWLDSEPDIEHTLEEMKSWAKFGARKETIDDEVLFCDSDIVKDVLETKNVLDEMSSSEMKSACFRSNSFETIRSSIFLNRAAVKMANIDSLTNNMFTSPTYNNEPLVKDYELLYFADICAGPGGFSEYIFYRKSWKAKGFGFTLKGENDFKLDEFYAGSPQSFDPFYGVKDDGNIYDEDNQDSLAEYIFKHTEDGVHFVMADGGFSVKGKENIQEILSKQLYLCQCLTALKILRTHGSFVCKLFDLFTPFSVGLIYLMYKCFERIAIIKPNSSRPANSERYIICQWKKHNTDDVCQYLNDMNRILSENDPNRDVRELVDLEIMKDDEKFFNYILISNNEIGKNQICALRKYAAFYRDTSLKDSEQSQIRKKCLLQWNLPNEMRQAPTLKTTEALLKSILSGNANKDFIYDKPKKIISKSLLDTHIKSVYDWYFIPIPRKESTINECGMFLCRTRGNLLKCTGGKNWELVDGVYEISPKSLFYGEIVYEYSGEGKTQRRILSLHIIDAIMLGDMNISHYKFSVRNQLCQLYAKSLNKPFKEAEFRLIRSKPIYKLPTLETFFQSMRLYQLKNGQTRYGLKLDNEERFFVPGGLLFFRNISENYRSVMSRRHNQLYYFNSNTGENDFLENMSKQKLNELYTTFQESFQNRILWEWENIYQVSECPIPPSDMESDKLYRFELQDFIKSKIPDS